MTEISALRRVLTAAGICTGVAIAVAGCSSSGGSNPVQAGSSAVNAVTSAAGSAAASVGAAASSAPAAMSSAAGGSSAAGSASGGGAGGGGGDKSAACTDIGTLVSKSGEIGKVATSSGGASAHFSELKSLYGDIASLSSKIAGEAPAAIAADAKKVATSINALNDAVKDASSVDDVKAKVASDPSLKTASTNFEGSLTNLVKYRATSCG